MYLDHFGLDSAPFNITSQTDFFYDGAARGATLDALLYAVQQGEGIVKVTGEVGSGKTMLCRMLLESLPDNVETIFLSVPSLKREEMVQALCIELGLDIQQQTPYQLLTLLQAKLVDLYAKNQRVLVLIDEAHAMPIESLEEIRLLSNLENSDHKLLQIILFGQPELNDHLRLPHMRQLKERITHGFQLHPLEKSDVGPYLAHRLESAGYQGPALFSNKCIKLMASASEGLTRRINILADKSLLAAYADNTSSVTQQHVRAAIRDSDFPLPSEWGKRLAVGAATLAAAGAIGFALSKTPWLSPASALSAKSVPAPPTGSEASKAKTMETPLAVSPSQIATQANEVKSEQDNLKPRNVLENTTKTDEKSQELGPPTGFNLDVKLSAAESPLETISAPKPASDKIIENPLIPPNTAQKIDKNKLPDKTQAATPAAQIAEINVNTAGSVEKNSTNTTNQSAPESTSSPLASAPSKWLQGRIASSKTWLEAQTSDQCVIQLLIADINNHSNVEYFLGLAERELGAKKGVYIFPSEINGQAKYTVTYADKGMDCRSALGKLPAPLKRSQPYIRSVELLRNEVKFPG
jgi:MSHA biogenesis protein MshM